VSRSRFGCRFSWDLRVRSKALVGTGLSNEMRLVILRELQATQRKTCPFSSEPDLRNHFGELRTDLPLHWVRPSLVVEVEYRQPL
jgi:ATP-dependent DNA ligase